MAQLMTMRVDLPAQQAGSAMPVLRGATDFLGTQCARLAPASLVPWRTQAAEPCRAWHSMKRRGTDEAG